jgi:hypothetical protein
VAAASALRLTHGVAPPLFLGTFFIIWLVGFAVLVRFYR